MRRFKFKKDDDVRDFIQSLIDDDMKFHLDDDPEEIIWKKYVTDCEVYLLKLNMIDLWNYCNPWLVLAKYPTLETEYLS